MSSFSSGTISSTRIVVQAYLNVTQVITQGSLQNQNINILCPTIDESCFDCIKLAKENKLISDNDYSELCPFCYCKLKNAKINNIITVNFQAFQNSSAKADFNSQVVNSIVQAATVSGNSLFKAPDPKDGSLTTINDNIYTNLNTVLDSQILQQLKSFQSIDMINPNTNLINIDLDLIVDFLSTTIQSNKSTSSTVNELDSQISQLINQQIEDPFTTVVTWMVTFALIGVMLLFFIFGFNIISQVLILYVST